MNFLFKPMIKPIIAALALAALASGAQAAYFDRVNYVASGGYSADTNGSPVSHSAVDLSGATGDVALLGAQSFVALSGGGSLNHSYAADAFLSFSTVSTDLSMTLSHSLDAAANAGAWSVTSHQQDAFVDLSTVTMKIVGQVGEDNGDAVNVSFAGSANALYDYGSLVSGGYLGLGLSVSRGNTVVGEYLWDVQASGDQNVSFSFAATVGEDLTFSSYMLSGAGLSNVNIPASGAPVALGQSGASLVGAFTIAPVPEPETYAMVLAGLGLVGWMGRRRRSTAQRQL